MTREATGAVGRLRKRVAGSLVTAAGRHRWVDITLRVLRRDLEVDGTVLAAALAFRLFSWLLPCALLVAAVLGFASSAGQTEKLGRGLRPLTANLLGQVGAQAERGRFITAVVSLVLLAMASVAVGRALDGIRARVWRCPADRRLKPALGRATRYAAVLFGLVVTNIAGATIGWPDVVISLPALAVYLVLASVLLSVAWPPRWRRTLPGAAVFAVGAEGLHLVALHYLPGKIDRATQFYGTLGAAAALLVWLTLIARLVVLGQVLNAVLSEPRPAG